jgi:hypothetical protein
VQARGVVFRTFLYLRILAPFKGVNWFAIWQNSSAETARSADSNL